MIFPLSSPPSLAEATPADLIAWTEGRALIATGSPFTPVTHKGITHVIGQANNAMLYPGLGLGAIVSRARLVSVGMLAAAANALSSLVAVRLPGASLLPHIDDLRSVTVTVAVAVAEAAAAEGLAGVELAGRRATGGRRDVAAAVSPDPGILTLASEGRDSKNVVEPRCEVGPASALCWRDRDAGLLRVRSGRHLDFSAS